MLPLNSSVISPVNLSPVVGAGSDLRQEGDEVVDVVDLRHHRPVLHNSILRLLGALVGGEGRAGHHARPS